MAEYCPECGRKNRDNARFCSGCGLNLILFTEPEPALVDDRYEIIEIVKAGAMGCVYKAKDTRLGVTVALKKLLAPGEDSLDRKKLETSFKREAEILSRLTHRGLPSVTDYFITKDHDTGLPGHYIVMSFIYGKDLQSEMDSWGDSPLPYDEALKYFSEILRILDYLHSLEPPVIYRDIKPSNIMIEEGNVVLVDFGIARIFAPGKQGTMIGTPGYAAPEQYKGFAEPRSDLYSLAVLFHYLLTGEDPQASNRPPFTFEPLRKVRPDVPPFLSDLVEAMLEISPNRRPKSAGEVLEILKKGEFTPSIKYVKKKKPSPFKNAGSNIPEPPQKGTVPDFDRPDEEGLTPLYRAVEKGDVRQASYLIHLGADLNVTGENEKTPLHLAVEKGLTNLAEELIEGGAFIDSIDSYSRTPLFNAVNGNDPEMIGLLLRMGADPSIGYADGRTPLHIAAATADESIIGRLLTAGAPVNALDNNELTPLHLAVETGSSGAVEILLRNGADPNAKRKDSFAMLFPFKENRSQWTPLHLAAAMNFLHLAVLLIQYGGRVDEKTSSGDDVLTLARKKNNFDLAKALERFRKP